MIHSLRAYQKLITHNTENLDIIMAVYNLLEYSENISMTSESLWIYYKEKINPDDSDISNTKSLKHKTLTTEKNTKTTPTF